MRSAGLFLTLLAALMEFCGLSSFMGNEVIEMEPLMDPLMYVCLDSSDDTYLDAMLYAPLDTAYNTDVYSSIDGTCSEYSFVVTTVTADSESEAMQACEDLGIPFGGSYAEEFYTLVPDNWWYCQ